MHLPHQEHKDGNEASDHLLEKPEARRKEQKGVHRGQTYARPKGAGSEHPPSKVPFKGS